MVERIAEAKGNYYYVIVIDNKECWIKMLPFEIYQNTKKNIIRCEYRGVDSYGSHIFIEDKLSILYELYKEKEEYDFNYVKEGIDMEGTHFSVLKDKYGLVHRLYEKLSSNQKNKETPIRCKVNSIDKTQKVLILQVIENINGNCVETNIQNTNDVTTIAWIDETTLFKSINKEELIDNYFYDIIHLSEDIHLKNVINLYQSKNNKWIVHYINYFDKTHKYILIQKGNLYELAEFADLMICLINWTRTFKISKIKKIPQLKKYEGLQKAIKILQTNSLGNYKETLICTENIISEMSTLFSLFEIEDIEEETEKNIYSSESISNKIRTRSNENIFFLNLYKDGMYIITNKQLFENNIIKSISINPNIDKFILQCYAHGSVNKVPIRILQEKKRERKYLNGCYSQDCLKDIYVISEETYIATLSLYNNDVFVKLYSTEYISEHLSLGLKGNQVVGTNVDSTEYFLISSEYIDRLPKRLIYNTPTPLGKNIKNPYYENDILILKELEILKETI